jgi:hypothetical protein
MDTPVSGTPRLLLRGEGLTLLIAAVVGYHAPWSRLARGVTAATATALPTARARTRSDPRTALAHRRPGSCCR